MAAHNDLGRWGEDLAERYLRQKGYTIIARDWCDYKRRDLDIVAMHDGMLVFVEVKTRRNNVFMEPEMAVNRKKMRSIALAADKFIKMWHGNEHMRFDVIAITGTSEDNCTINHIEDAFCPALVF